MAGARGDQGRPLGGSCSHVVAMIGNPRSAASQERQRPEFQRMRPENALAVRSEDCATRLNCGSGMRFCGDPPGFACGILLTAFPRIAPSFWRIDHVNLRATAQSTVRVIDDSPRILAAGRGAGGLPER